VLEQPDHKILVAGGFNKFDLVPVTGMVRLEDVTSPGFIRLISNRIEVFDNQPFASIEMERVDGSQGVLSATVQTIDQSAIAGSDYISTNVTVQFGDGEFGLKTVQIPIIVNTNLTGNKTFAVRFTTGAQVQDVPVVI